MFTRLAGQIFGSSSIFKCKLCWRITFGVFFAILVVEAAILLFSVDSYKEDRLKEVEREALVVARSIIRASSATPDMSQGIATLGPSLRDNAVLLGVRIYDTDGKMVGQFGEQPAAPTGTLSAYEVTIRNFVDENEFLDVLWPAKRFSDKYLVAARIDTSEIDAQTIAFIWRINGLVLLISVFVTIVTMMVLEKSILSPIRFLRDRLLHASQDPNHPSLYLMKDKHENEWGDVVTALNQLLTQSGLNLEKIKAQEKELRAHRDELEELVAQRTAKLDKERKRAERANKAKSAFLSNISHELRTPLNSMIGFSDLQKQQIHGPIGDENYLDYANEINSSSKNLLELINTILDITILESGDLEIGSQQFDIYQLIQAVCKTQKQHSEQQNITLEVPKADFPLIVTGDEKRMRQALNSLVSNAIKFSHPNGTVSISIDYERNKTLQISVTDQGVGMDEESLEKALESFGQVEISYDRDYDGIGLGLSLTKTIVELHDGTLELASQKNIGTTAAITLPSDRVEELNIPA